MIDRLSARVVLATLCGLAVVLAVGLVVLAALHTEIPDALLSLTSAVVGGVVALATTRTTDGLSVVPDEPVEAVTVTRPRRTA